MTTTSERPAGTEALVDTSRARGSTSRVGRADREHPHRHAAPDLAQHRPSTLAGGHLDRVGVDVIAGVADARDHDGARMQRPLRASGGDPVVRLVRIRELALVQRRADVEDAVAPVAARRTAAERLELALRTSAFVTSAAFQSRWVAQTIAAAAVTSGAENEVPTGVMTYGMLFEAAVEAITLMPSAGATRSTCGPRVDFDQTFWSSRAPARRRRARPAARPG